MATQTLFRLCGLALVVGALLAPLSAWLHPPGHTVALALSPRWVPAHMAGYAMALLSVVGVCGLYARIAGRVGAAGLVAFMVLFVHFMNLAHAVLTETLVVHPLALDQATRGAAHAILHGTLQSPGWAGALQRGPSIIGPILFGLVLVRVGHPWRSPGAALIGATLLTMALFASGHSYWAFRVGGVLGQFSLGWTGLTLWRESRIAGIHGAPLAAEA